MSSIKDQNKKQFFPNNLNEESSSDFFSEKDKENLIDFFFILAQWDIEDKKNEETGEINKCNLKSTNN